MLLGLNNVFNIRPSCVLDWRNVLKAEQCF